MAAACKGPDILIKTNAVVIICTTSTSTPTKIISLLQQKALLLIVLALAIFSSLSCIKTMSAT